MPILDLKNEKEVERYNKFLENYGVVGYKQTLWWGDVKADNWTKEVVYLEENNKIIAGMMVLFRYAGKIKKSIAYAPRGPICDIYNTDILKRLISEMDPLVKKYNTFVLTMDPDVRSNEELKEKLEKEGYKLSPPDADSLHMFQMADSMIIENLDKTNFEDFLASLPSKTRYNYNYAIKHGVKCYWSHKEEDLKTFFELYKIMNKRSEIVGRAYSHFERVMEYFPKDKIRIYVCEKDGEKLSAAITFNWAGETYYIFGASSNSKRNLFPNYLMQMEMIKWAFETKSKIYNFGQIYVADDKDGLYSFKRRFTGPEGHIKYIGEIDKVYSKFWYFLYKSVFPVLRNINFYFADLKRKIKARKNK